MVNVIRLSLIFSVSLAKLQRRVSSLFVTQSVDLLEQTMVILAYAPAKIGIGTFHNILYLIYNISIKQNCNAQGSTQHSLKAII